MTALVFSYEKVHQSSHSRKTKLQTQAQQQENQ